MSINSKNDKPTVISVHHGILLGNKKEWTVETHNDIKNLKTYAEYKKLYLKEDYIIFFKIKFENRQNQYVVEKIGTAFASKAWAGGGLTRKGHVKYCGALCPEFLTQDQEFTFLISFQQLVL